MLSVLEGVALVYIVGHLYTWWKAAGIIAWQNAQKNWKSYPNLYSKETAKGNVPRGEQWSEGIFCGLGVSLLWPVTLPMLSAKVRGGGLYAFFYKPPMAREILLDKRSKELDALAKQLGVRV